VQRGLRNCDAIVAPTAAFGTQISRTYALSREVQMVPNGRTPPPLPERERGNFALTVGRLWDEGKNVRTLDEAARMTTVPIEAIGPVRSPDGSPVAFHYLVIGGAVDETEIAERLAARPIFASAAIYEPFGLSVLEAAQAGCALILSDIPTFRELWADAAMLVPATGAQRFADAIASLLANPELRDAYGQAAQRRAAQYTPEATARSMVEIYEKLTAAPVCADIASAA
jgi:glycosyltransferase involved in cell wall biosynthesis